MSRIVLLCLSLLFPGPASPDTKPPAQKLVASVSNPAVKKHRPASPLEKAIAQLRASKDTEKRAKLAQRILTLLPVNQDSNLISSEELVDALGRRIPPLPAVLEKARTLTAAFRETPNPDSLQVLMLYIRDQRIPLRQIPITFEAINQKLDPTPERPSPHRPPIRCPPPFHKRRTLFFIFTHTQQSR